MMNNSEQPAKNLQAPGYLRFDEGMGNGELLLGIVRSFSWRGRIAGASKFSRGRLHRLRRLV